MVPRLGSKVRFEGLGLVSFDALHVRVEKINNKLARQDSNLGYQDQNLGCYRYTTG